ncbi:MAG: diguanylate cyclase [Proteobacteria bacterium]|nr:diguanylate cyclase [Pseudomonadota bacterium]MBI3499677.1 diguanylate cyclase [Pseudomonadota bacterium]
MSSALTKSQSEDAEVAAACRLLAAGGTLWLSPGPALIIAPGPTVRAANKAAAALVDALAAGGLPGLAELAQRTLAGEPQSERLQIQAGGEAMTVELVLARLGAGSDVLILGRDATLDQNLRNALVESRQRYKDLVEISSDFVWETGADGRFVFVSSKGALGYSADALVGSPPDSLALDSRSAGRMPFTARSPVDSVEVWCRNADGGAVCLVASAAPLTDQAGEWRGARGVCRDVTAEREREAAFARSRNRQVLLARLVRTIRDEVEPQNMLGAAATTTARALGAAGCVVFRKSAEEFLPAASRGQVPPEPVVQAILASLADAAGVIAIETEASGRALATPTFYRQRRNGALLLWRASTDRPWDAEESDLLGDVAGQLGIAFEQIAAHEELTRLSSTDALTGLMNRRTFLLALEQRMAAAALSRTQATLAYVDLDNFKQVNDRRGHQAGDEALREVARLLRATVRPDDLLARLGGDEFALWLERSDEIAARAFGERLIAVGRGLLPLSADPERPLGLSVGMAVHAPGKGEALETLIARADATMYEVKRTGKGRCLIAPASAGGQPATPASENGR